MKIVQLLKLSAGVCILQMSVACSETPMPSNTTTTTTGTNTSAGPVILDAQVVRWDDSHIDINYTLDNQSEKQLVVFPFSGIKLVDGVIRILLAQYVVPESTIDSLVPPLIPGQFLAVGDAITRTVPIGLPVSITERPSIEPLFPEESIEFCVGHGPADEMRQESPDRDGVQYYLDRGADAVYLRGGWQLDLQTLQCVMLGPG